MSRSKILIVEPSRELSAVLAKAFRQSGMDVAAAHTAQEGIRMADKKTPALVVLELIMPRHNGLEFIHEFRSYPEWLDVPIIIYSQVSPDELGADKAMLEEMGIKNHFYKPTTSLEKLAKAAEAIFEPVSV